MSLPDQIDAEIRASGPMSVATYMSLCLGHPRDGYYVKGRPIGTHGDFITALDHFNERNAFTFG